MVQNHPKTNAQAWTMQLLKALLKKCLPEITEEETIDILALREHKKGYLEDLVEVEEITDLFSPADQQQIENDVTEEKQDKAERRQFKKELKEMRKIHRDKVKLMPKAKGDAQSRRRARFMKPIDPTSRARLPSNVLPGLLSREEVEAMAPPLAVVYHDTFNARWLVSLEGWKKSRSWLKYGHRESAMIVLAKAWRRYMEVRRPLFALGLLTWEPNVRCCFLASLAQGEVGARPRGGGGMSDTDTVVNRGYTAWGAVRWNTS